MDGDAANSEAARRVTAINELLADGRHQAALENAYELKRFLQGHVDSGEDVEKRLKEAEAAIATLEAAGYRAINIELPDVRGAFRRLGEAANASLNQLKSTSRAETPLAPSVSVAPVRVPPSPPSRRTVSIFALLVLLASSVPLYQWLQVQAENRTLQSRMDKVLAADPRNSGITVNPCLSAYGEPRVLVYDLTSVGSSNSMMDVLRVLLQYASEIGNEKFDTVELAFRGNKKFKMTGTFFHTLGADYGTQNPVYTIRTFPENLMRMDGGRAYSEWTGGVLGVLNKQMEDVKDFHKKWYLDEL